MNAWAHTHRTELRLSLRITLAGLLTYALAHGLHLAGAMTAVLTSVIVMQASVGGALTASRDRLLSTAAGGVWSVLVTFVLRHPMPLEHWLSLIFGLTPLAVLAAFRPSFRVAPVTAVIVLLNPVVGQTPLVSAMSRLTEILVGTTVAMTVALFVLPGRAQGLMLEQAAQLLKHLSEEADRCADGSEPSRQVARTVVGPTQLHASIRAGLARMQSLVGEANRERDNHLSSAPDPTPFLRATRRVYHDLTVFALVAEPQPPTVESVLGETSAGGYRALAQGLRDMAEGIVTGKWPVAEPVVGAALAKYQQVLSEMRETDFFRSLSGEQLNRIFSYSFLLDQINRDLGELSMRTGELMQVQS